MTEAKRKITKRKARGRSELTFLGLSLSLINGKGTSTDTQAKGVGPRDPFGGLSDTIALSSSAR